MTQEHLPLPTSQASDPLPMLLATEHWSLLGTRSMTWAEIMSRITILLTVASAGLVVLALVAQSNGFTTPFWVLAIGLNATILALGTLTGIRVSLASQEDAQLILGMNRLRAAYVDLAPEIVPYLTASAADDGRGLLQTYTLGAPRPLWAHILGSTNFFLSTINSILAGVLAALVTHQSGGATVLTSVLGTLAGLLYFAGMLAVGMRLFRTSRAAPRFPSSPEATSIPQ
jgi:hypothetical protein